MNPKPFLASRPVSRRWLLAGVPAAVVVIAGCGSSSTSSSSGSSTTASSATASGAAAAGSVAALAQAFYATLTDAQKPKVLLDYTLSTAERWSNLPQSLLTRGGQSSKQSRVGLSIGNLDDTQLAAFTTMLKAATGSRPGLGYDQIVQQLNADDYLKANGGGNDYGRANYYVAILGSPQDSGTWEFQFGGHHVALANTYVDGKLAGATPSFRGVEPNAAFEQNGTSNQPMKVKEDAFKALLAGMSTDELASGKLSDTFTDLVLKPGNDWAFPTKHDGVQVSAFPAATKALVLAAVATYVDDIADADAATILATYESELDDTFVAYSGTTALTEENDYVRVDGPSVWIEFSMQHGIVLSGNHPHSVWRDRKTDYAETKS